MGALLALVMVSGCATGPKLGYVSGHVGAANRAAIASRRMEYLEVEPEKAAEVEAEIRFGASDREAYATVGVPLRSLVRAVRARGATLGERAKMFGAQVLDLAGWGALGAAGVAAGTGIARAFKSDDSKRDRAPATGRDSSYIGENSGNVNVYMGSSDAVESPPLQDSKSNRDTERRAN